MKIRTISAGAVAAVALMAPATAAAVDIDQLAPPSNAPREPIAIAQPDRGEPSRLWAFRRLTCFKGYGYASGARIARCSQLDRKMARQLVGKVDDRMVDNFGPLSALCNTRRAPRIWTCQVEFELASPDLLYADATIRRSGGVHPDLTHECVEALARIRTAQLEGVEGQRIRRW